MDLDTDRINTIVKEMATVVMHNNGLAIQTEQSASDYFNEKFGRSVASRK